MKIEEKFLIIILIVILALLILLLGLFFILQAEIDGLISVVVDIIQLMKLKGCLT